MAEFTPIYRFTSFSEGQRPEAVAWGLIRAIQEGPRW
jgi:hypothetical protein